MTDFTAEMPDIDENIAQYFRLHEYPAISAARGGITSRAPGARDARRAPAFVNHVSR